MKIYRDYQKPRNHSFTCKSIDHIHSNDERRIGALPPPQKKKLPQVCTTYLRYVSALTDIWYLFFIYLLCIKPNTRHNVYNIQGMNIQRHSVYKFALLIVIVTIPYNTCLRAVSRRRRRRLKRRRQRRSEIVGVLRGPWWTIATSRSTYNVARSRYQPAGDDSSSSPSNTILAGRQKQRRQHAVDCDEDDKSCMCGYHAPRSLYRAARRRCRHRELSRASIDFSVSFAARPVTANINLFQINDARRVCLAYQHKSYTVFLISIFFRNWGFILYRIA